MKTLVVYNKEGQIIFTQTNATSSYNLIVADVPDGKEIDGVDAINNKVLLRDSSIDKSELEKTNEKILQLQAKIQEAMSVLDEVLNGGGC